MATMMVVPNPKLAPMKAVQILKPGADFEIVERPERPATRSEVPAVKSAAVAFPPEIKA